MSGDNHTNNAAEEFLASFREGGEKGMTCIFNKYYKRLCLYAKTILDDEFTAEDVVQDCFVKIWSKKLPLENITGLSTYLYTMIRHACYNQKRESRARRGRENKLVSLQHTSYDAGHQLIFSETLYEIYATMVVLPPKCREIFRMMYIQGMDHVQIARQLNVAESTVRVQKARAISIIKQKLHLLLLAGIAFSLLS